MPHASFVLFKTPSVALRTPSADAKIIAMRVNLITEPSGTYLNGTETFAVSMTIRPACGLPGEYIYPTDSEALLRLLRRATDLPSTVLKRFEIDMCTCPKAKLLGVELDDDVLTAIGYFID